MGDFHQDVDRLMDAVEEVVGDKEKPLPFRISNFIKRRASILGLALALLVVAFVAYLNFLPPTTVVQPKATISAVDATPVEGVHQFGRVSRASSYLSSSDVRSHFGLGDHPVLKQVRITWPSGVVQKLESVVVNQFLEIEEPVE